MLKLSVIATTLSLILSPMKLTGTQQITPPHRLNTDSERITEDSALFVTYYQKNISVPSDSSALYMMADSIAAIRNNGVIRSVEIVGSASPDGSFSLNSRLAAKRAYGVKSFLIARTHVDTVLISVRTIAENWELLNSIISGDSSRFADSMRAIASPREPESREESLRNLSKGSKWRIFATEVFPKLRLVAVTVKSSPAPSLSGVSTTFISDSEDTAAPPRQAEQNDASTDLADAASPTRHLYLKSNAPAWAMLWMNIAAELDVAPHWSVALPVYYSGFNYFTGHTKFRTFAVIPEARYWWRDDNSGWFIGAHFGLAYYNVAFGGDHRYQDHGKRSPALGGGVSGGFRMPITSDGRWSMEASIGAGVYHLDYDVFDNRHNGLIFDRRRHAFVGIDNVALSFCYRFDMKGGGR